MTRSGSVRQRKDHAYRQAIQIGLCPRDAWAVANSVGRQIAIVRSGKQETPAGRVELRFHEEFMRLVLDGDQSWYARALASLRAAELALEIGHQANWKNVIRDAGTVAEADCDGTDDEAFAAAEAAKDAWRKRIPQYTGA